MDKKTALILKAVLVFVASIFGLVFSPLANPDVTQVFAQTCPTPPQVQNVLVEYPGCVGDTCNFTQASCSWDQVSGATQYKLTMTQVESGSVVVSETVTATSSSKIFNVVQGKTYKCEVAAVNSCGAVGLAGSHSLLCQVDALVETTPTPTVAQVACGFPCTSNAECQSGHTCAIGSSGQGYCALSAYVSACQKTPSVSACCSAPPKPTIPPPGGFEFPLTLGLGVSVLFILGAAFLLFI